MIPFTNPNNDFINAWRAAWNEVDQPNVKPRCRKVYRTECGKDHNVGVLMDLFEKLPDQLQANMNDLFDIEYDHGQVVIILKESVLDGKHDIMYAPASNQLIVTDLQPATQPNQANKEEYYIVTKATFYDSGQQKRKVSFKANTIDRKEEHWYPNGQRRSITFFTKSCKDGIHKTWYATGQLRNRDTYKDGKLDGLSEVWNTDGVLTSRISWKNGELSGLSEAWYHNGKLKYRRTYKNNMLNGLFEEWYDNGRLERIKTFKDDMLDGLSEAWCSSGRCYYRNFWKDGRSLME